MKKLYLDTETCGFHGLPVLIQYAIDDGDIQLFEPWTRPAHESCDLIEELMQHALVGFNLSFDMFHLCKLYTIFRLLPPDMIPAENIPLVATLEPVGRDGPCVKPASALDLMLISRQDKYQCLMSRDPVRIRKVPTVLAGALAKELEDRIELDGILFAKRKDTNAPKWQVYDRKNKKGEIDPDFKDVCLMFNPAGGLKFLAEYALGLDPEFHSFKDVEVPKEFRPYELGYVPFALGVSTPEKNWECFDKHGESKGHAWPAVIENHIDHWATNEEARRYARDDVKYTRLLDEHFGCPEPGDDDSVLSCMVAAVRWHGFVVDTDKTSELLAKAQAIVERSPVNVNKPDQVRRYIRDCMDDTEALLIDDSTKKSNLEQIRDEMVVEEEGELCIKCFGDGCLRCRGKGELDRGPMPASERAREILEIKQAAKEVELHSKLLKAGRFHASFKVIGTLSSRMSGGDGLNAQGIKHSEEVRSMFPLAWDGMVLCGGDFDSFEVTLADAVFKDPALRAALLSGKKIHALMGQAIYPGTSYEEILASDGNKELDMYARGKQAVFAMLYGGDHNTIHNKLAIPLSVAEDAFTRFQRQYPGIKRSREDNFERFQALKQPDGIGTAITWTEPDDYSETFLGFRRYFTLENRVSKELFNLARRPPKHWRKVDLKVVRRDREQRVAGAVSSAVYGSAFQIQAGNTRAANNHLIQSPGAQITKRVQRRIWDLQPAGVNDWLVAPMNIHDEIMVVTHPSVVDAVAEVVEESVESYRPQVPLIGMKWFKKLLNWGEKGDGADLVHIKPPEENDGQGIPSQLVEALDEGATGSFGITESDCELEQAAQDEADLAAIESEWSL
ncbi:MAG: DNA polymerase [Planctomycetota bacterium]|jgi:hypothetical protein